MSTATVTILPAAKSADFAEGTNLFEALLQLEPRLEDRKNADKDGSFGHVYVKEGRKGLSKTSREENEKLDAIVGVGSKSRLANLITILGTENVTIELLGFDYAGL